MARLNAVQVELEKHLAPEKIAALDGFVCGYCGSRVNSGRCMYGTVQREQRPAGHPPCSEGEMLLRAPACDEDRPK